METEFSIVKRGPSIIRILAQLFSDGISNSLNWLEMPMPIIVFLNNAGKCQTMLGNAKVIWELLCNAGQHSLLQRNMLKVKLIAALDTIHYGRFRENLSQNSRSYIFSLIWHFPVPLALWNIENLLKTKKGQQRS